MATDTATYLLLRLAFEVALLLWSIQLLSSSVQRAFGTRLRHAIAVGVRGRFSAFLSGVAVTGLLQSSTATALMVTSLGTATMLDLVPGLAVMLGANVGTTLIVQVVSFDIGWVYPLLFIAGFTAQRRAGERSALRDAGGALMGLALMLLALHMLVETLHPLETSQATRDVLKAITPDPFLNMLLAALLAWAAHSSVAAMLFIMSLAGTGIITPEAALAMVLGANLGSAVNPVTAAMGKDPSRLRIPVGNLAFRAIGCVIALPLIPLAVKGLTALGEPPGRMAADFHMLFNVGTALIFIGILPVAARILMRLLPDPPRPTDPGEPQYLDAAALATPSVALSNASREILRMVDVVDAMLRGSQDAFRHDDRERIVQVSAMDNILDRLYRAIQRYLGAMGPDALSEEDAQRASEILQIAINLEHIGDIADKNLMKLAAKRLDNRYTLPPEAMHDIEEMHGRLLDHLQLAVTVFMVQDVQAARRLVTEKEHFREIERSATERHFATMRRNNANAVAESALHLDITRDLKRIDAHIAATVYGTLEKIGVLRASRLRP